MGDNQKMRCIERVANQIKKELRSIKLGNSEPDNKRLNLLLDNLQQTDEAYYQKLLLKYVEICKEKKLKIN